MSRKNETWIYYIKFYFDILIELNGTFIKLICFDGKEHNEKREKLYFEVFDKISRLIPVYARFNDKIVKPDYECGVFELTKNNVNFVEADLTNIINKYNYELFNIKILRNNAEHNPHLILSTTYINKGSY